MADAEWEVTPFGVLDVDLAAAHIVSILVNAPEDVLQVGLGFRQVGWFDPVFGEVWSMKAVEEMTSLDKHFMQPLWTRRTE